MQTNLVSVVMPVYQRGSTVTQAISSVLAQTAGNFELIVVDDGSTDDTSARLSEFTDNRLKKLTLSVNRGQSYARNTAIREASGEFVCFLDSDDEWPKEKLSQQLAILQTAPEFDVLYGYELSYADRECPDRLVGKPSGFIHRDLLKENFVDINTVMLRRACLEESGLFDEKLRAGEDFDLWVRLSRYSRFLYVPLVWSYYRMSGKRVSDQFDSVFEANLQTIQREFSYESTVDSKSRRLILARLYTRWARHHHAAGNLQRSFTNYLRALRYRWHHTNAWRGLARTIINRGSK